MLIFELYKIRSWQTTRSTTVNAIAIILIWVIQKNYRKSLNLAKYICITVAFALNTIVATTRDSEMSSSKWSKQKIVQPKSENVLSSHTSPQFKCECIIRLKISPEPNVEKFTFSTELKLNIHIGQSGFGIRTETENY